MASLSLRSLAPHACVPNMQRLRHTKLSFSLLIVTTSRIKQQGVPSTIFRNLLEFVFVTLRWRRQHALANSKTDCKVGSWHWSPSPRRETSSWPNNRIEKANGPVLRFLASLRSYKNKTAYKIKPCQWTITLTQRCPAVIIYLNHKIKSILRLTSRQMSNYDMQSFCISSWCLVH